MNRFLALIGALFLSFVTIASACAADAPGLVHFTLRPDKSGDRIQADFRSEEGSATTTTGRPGFGPATSLASTLPAFGRAAPVPFAFP